jgi:lysophospholipase L1-like esterase
MKSFLHKSLFSAFVLAAFFSCKPNLTVPTATRGAIDPTRYVAIGNSITSGYADGALSYNGQLASYPNLLSQQFKLIGGGNFSQPLMSPSSIGVGMSGGAPFKLGYSTDCLGVTSLAPVPVAASGDVGAFSASIYASQGPFNNMGVPGAKAITVVAPGYGNPGNGPGNFNPFFTRMASNPATASMLSDAVAINPTFFSVFIGNNDVLQYAVNGGAADFITPPTGIAGTGFDGSIAAIVAALTANGAKGVIGNVPDITSLPFFTTIPWNGLALRQGQADTLNSFMPSGTGGSLYNFHAGNNAFVIEDPSVPFLKKRQILPGELILLDTPLDSVKCHYLGTLVPIPNKHVLTLTEIAKIQAAVSAYNSTILSVAQSNNLAYVDVNAFMSRTKTGIVYNGIPLNAQFVTGGAFSLDGIHLNPVGNALLANEFIKAINANYGSTIPQVDATKYRGIIFP